MDTDINTYQQIRPGYVAIKPINPKADFKPDGSKYELHFIGEIINKNLGVNHMEIGDIVMYDGTKSVTIIESEPNIELVHEDYILAVKTKEQ